MQYPFVTESEIKALPAYVVTDHPGFRIHSAIPVYPYPGCPLTLEDAVTITFLVVETVDPGCPRIGFLADGSVIPTGEGSPQVIDGSIKWDGCVNLRTDPSEQVCDHFCDPEGLTLKFIPEISEAIYALGPRMKHWDL